MRLLSFFRKSSVTGIRGATTNVDVLLDELDKAGIKGKMSKYTTYESVYSVGGWDVHVHLRFGAKGLPYAWILESK